MSAPYHEFIRQLGLAEFDTLRSYFACRHERAASFTGLEDRNKWDLIIRPHSEFSCTSALDDQRQVPKVRLDCRLEQNNDSLETDFRQNLS